MNFKPHYELIDQHAFLGASKYHWVNYNEEKLDSSFQTYMAKQEGTKLHQFACDCINLGQKLPKSRKTLNMYVNDAIGFKMTPEQPLYYSDNCFGTTDAISFRNNFLRIHDYKSGVVPASPKQLEIYTALFCLEYNVDPKDIDIELRIYQSNEVIIHIPDKPHIIHIIDKIIAFDKRIDAIKFGNI